MYADISIQFYEKLGFVPLPDELQKLKPSDKEKVKKISIVQTNNSLDVLEVPNWVYFQNDISELNKLKKYTETKGFLPKFETEKELVFSALSWVSRQWEHDGMNEPPKSFHAIDILKEVHNKNIRYHCVEYGLVLAELLQSHGFVTRTLALRSKDVAYGGFGQGHVAMEVWLNDIGKWIFLDPQFGVYITNSNSKIPLSYFEIYKEKKSGNYDSLTVNTVLSGKNILKKITNKIEYLKFLSNYFGHMAISDRANNQVYSLLLDAQTEPLTFQGAALNNAVFTRRSDLFYPEMNRIALLLSYKDEDVNFMELMKKLKIETNKDYLEKMSLFAVKPNFKITIRSVSKFKETYQFRNRSSDSWKEVMGSTKEYLNLSKFKC